MQTNTIYNIFIISAISFLSNPSTTKIIHACSLLLLTYFDFKKHKNYQCFEYILIV